MKRTIFVLIASFILLLLHINAFFRFPNANIADLFLFAALPIILTALLGFKPAEIGLTMGDWRKWSKPVAILLLISLPLIFIGSRLSQFYSYYPIASQARFDPATFLAYEAIILVFMFSTEFFFRGFLLFGARKLGDSKANLLQAIPYALLHLGKPPLEIPAAFLAGLIFGKLDQESKSMFPSLILHFGFSLAMDLLCIQAFLVNSA